MVERIIYRGADPRRRAAARPQPRFAPAVCRTATCTTSCRLWRPLEGGALVPGCHALRESLSNAPSVTSSSSPQARSRPTRACGAGTPETPLLCGGFTSARQIPARNCVLDVSAHIGHPDLQGRVLRPEAERRSRSSRRPERRAGGEQVIHGLVIARPHHRISRSGPPSATAPRPPCDSWH